MDWVSGEWFLCSGCAAHWSPRTMAAPRTMTTSSRVSPPTTPELVALDHVLALCVGVSGAGVWRCLAFVARAQACEK